MAFISKLAPILLLFTTVGFAETPVWQGEWSTYYYRGTFGMQRSDLSIQDDSWVESLVFSTVLPMASKDGQRHRQSFHVAKITRDPKRKNQWIVDLRVERIEVAPSGGWEAEALNRDGHCGIFRWEPGKYRDITGRVCQEEDDRGSRPVRQYRRGAPVTRRIAFRDGHLYIINPIQPMNSKNPDIDWDHPLYLRQAGH